MHISAEKLNNCHGCDRFLAELPMACHSPMSKRFYASQLPNVPVNNLPSEINLL